MSLFAKLGIQEARIVEEFLSHLRADVDALLQERDEPKCESTWAELLKRTRSYYCTTRPPEPCGCPDKAHDTSKES